jgi:hypothetical protein
MSTEKSVCHATEWRRVYFFHLPKTGGSSVGRTLRQRFGIAVKQPRKKKRFLTDIVAAHKFEPTEAPQSHLIGHYVSWSLIADNSDEYYKACFWRHPADWVLSLYNYRLYRNRHRLRRTFRLEDFRKSMLRNPMTEHLLLYCGDVRGIHYFFMSDAEKFKRAVEIVSRFDLFADISRVDAFLDVIAPANGGPLRRSNHIPLEERTLSSLPKHMRSEIERHSPIDYLLHRLALSGDRTAVVLEAQQLLQRNFAVTDLWLLVALPYYRWKTWVLPFIDTSIAPLQDNALRTAVARPVARQLAKKMLRRN